MNILKFLGIRWAWSFGKGYEIEEEEIREKYPEYNRESLVLKLKRKGVEFKFNKNKLLIRKWVYENFYFWLIWSIIR